MVYIPEGGKEQFRVQNWFRNITIGFQPFVPFSQAYRMTLQNEIIMTQSRGSTGYMHYAPKEQEAESENLHTLKRYPWGEPGGRLDAFRGQGAGRLATMSTKPFNRLERALDVAGGLGGQVEMKKLGDRFSKVLDSMGDSYEGVTFQNLSSREHQEIMLRMIETYAEEVSLTPQGQFTDRNTMFKGSRDELRTGGQWGGQFDIPLEKARSFGDYLESEMSRPIAEGGIGSKVSLEKLGALNLEISRAKAKEGGNKLFTAMNTNNMTRGQAQEAFKDRLEKLIGDDETGTIGSMNQDLIDRYGRIASSVAQGDSQIAKLKGLRGTYLQPKGFEQLSADNVYNTALQREWDAEMRQMLDRQIENLKGIDRSNIGRATHLWSAPLTEDTLGLTWFYPTSTSGPVRTSVVQPQSYQGSRTGIPQIGWSRDMTFALSAVAGDIAMGYITWMKEQGHISPIQAANVTARAAIDAANVSVSTLNRISALESQVFNNPNVLDVNPQLTVSMSTLRGTKIAEELGKQLTEYYESGQMKSELRAWYEQLMEESNRITNVWKAAMADISNTRGSSNLHREYIIGDELGNPRKHYLGVWGDVMEPTWKGAGEGAKGDVGYNLSIAPFITSRRRGVAQYGQ